MYGYGIMEDECRVCIQTLRGRLLSILITAGILVCMVVVVVAGMVFSR